ncbi:MAG TPA: 6-phosphogluconolactonase [Lentisphaeria bacterium]|nr:6-phosphogluconolactonase [Lentisphaeria bacterium]
MLLEALVYIGTAIVGSNEGIYLSRLNLETGQLSAPELAAATERPAFLATGPEDRVLYATGGKSSTVAAFTIGPEAGTLSLINRQVVSEMSLCHITTALDGSVLLGADYGHAKAVSFPLQPDGRICAPATVLTYDQASNVDPQRQNKPHLHSINADSSEKFALVCDFSGDAIRICALDPLTKVLTAAGSTPSAPGAGPRHLVCHPAGKWVYVINELGGTVSLFDFSDGALTHRQTVATLPADFSGKNTTAEVAFSPDLRFLYGTNRGHDSLACFRVNPENGELTREAIVSTGGEHPRYFTIDSSGRFMLVSNRDTNNVVVFKLNPETGVAQPTGHQIKLEKPMGIKIIATKRQK